MLGYVVSSRTSITPFFVCGAKHSILWHGCAALEKVVRGLLPRVKTFKHWNCGRKVYEALRIETRIKNAVVQQQSRYLPKR